MSFPTGGDVNDVMYVWLVISNRTFSTLRRLLLESFSFAPITQILSRPAMTIDAADTSAARRPRDSTR